MITADKQWIEDKTQLDDMIDENITAFKQNGKYNLTILVPETLLDQLRRDAKKELLEEISQNYWWSNEDNTDEGIHLTFEELKQLKKNTLEDN